MIRVVVVVMIRVVVVVVIRVVVVVVVRVVVVVVRVVRMPAADARGGPVVVLLDPAAELHAVAAEGQLLVGEGGERGLVGRRRQRLDADRLEVTKLHPGAEPAGQPVHLLLIDVGPHHPRPVHEPGADVLDAVIDLDFVVAPVDDVQADAHPLHHPVVQVAEADVEPAGAAAEVEVDVGVLRIVRMRVLVAVIVVVVVVVLAVPVVVEHACERDAVPAVLGGHAAAGEQPVTEPAEPGPHVRQFGLRVLNRSLRRLVGAGAAYAPAPPENGGAERVLQAGVRPRLPVRASGVGAELRPRPVERRLAEAFVRRDDVDDTPDGVRAVEQRRRPAHDLDPLGAVRIDGDAVIARLAGQVARTDAVLQDQHPVTVEPPDDRPARPGAEAAARNPGCVLQRVAEADGRLPDQIERVERGHGVERLERRFGPAHRGGHRHVLVVHQREFEREVDGHRLTRGYGDHLALRGEMLPLGQDFVLAGRQTADIERPPLVGQREPPRPKHQDRGAVDRIAPLHQRHRAAHGAGLLRPRGRCGSRKQKSDDDDRCGGFPDTAYGQSMHDSPLQRWRCNASDQGRAATSRRFAHRLSLHDRRRQRDGNQTGGPRAGRREKRPGALQPARSSGANAAGRDAGPTEIESSRSAAG